MKCPYTGTECPRCDTKCELDGEREAITGKLVLDLSGVTFTCDCGAVIRTPFHPCETEGCQFSKIELDAKSVKRILRG